MVEILHRVMAHCKVRKSTPAYLGMSKATDSFLQTLNHKNIHCLLANEYVQTVQCSAENALQTAQSVSENNNYHHPLPDDAGTRSASSEGADGRHLMAGGGSFDDDSVGSTAF